MRDLYARYRKLEFGNIPVVRNSGIPNDEVWVVQGGAMVAKIVNLSISQAIRQHSQKGRDNE